MKQILLIALLLINLKIFAQDVIYFKNGSKVPGKISQINKDTVKFKNLANPAGPIYSVNIDNLEIVFNASGNYLIIDPAKAITDQEKDAFINKAVKRRQNDIIIGTDGKLSALTVTDENEKAIAVLDSGKNKRISKQSLALLIRKNGEHVFFINPELMLVTLSKNQDRINELAFSENLAQQSGSASTDQGTIKLSHRDDIIEPDMASFGVKALDKATEFTGYLRAITSAGIGRDVAKKNIDQALNLFLDSGKNARIEVSTRNSPISNKYKILDYLNRLLIKSGQFDKVDVEFAEINYASRFQKGIDGNYYGTVTFVQKFKGFIDGNLVYGDRTKRSITIILKHYDKEINGMKVSLWDLYLGDVGTLETKKI